MRFATSLLGAVMMTALAGGAMAQGDPAAATPRMVTTGTLAELCRASATDSTMATALGYCRGFIVGVGQYHLEVTRQGALAPIFCLPDPAPTLDGLQMAFVAWAASHPERAGERALDGLLRFAAEAYPCPSPAPRRGARR